jgi:hypothetical protein
MNVDQIPDRVWAKVIDGGASISCEFLALSLLITNIRQRRRSNAIATPQAITEFKAFFAKYGALPAAQRDLAKLINL